MPDLLSFYSRASRRWMLLLAALLVAGIALLDWRHPSFISLGFLYVFPIMLVGGFLGPGSILALAFVCAGLQELFGDLPRHEAVVRFVLASLGFAGTGLFVWESLRSRRTVAGYVDQLEKQMRLRKDAEEQVRALVESSPAAILTIDATGRILVANQAAQRLFAPEGPPLAGREVKAYLPSLQAVLDAGAARQFRTTLQGKAMRHDGEVFLAAVWFSTYATSGGSRLAAIVVDLSEDLRSREDVSLDDLLRHARIVMTALAHEMRNLSSAALVVHKNLSRLQGLEGNEDFMALGTLVHALESLAEEELRPPVSDEWPRLDLGPVLDELRVLTDATLAEDAISCTWPPPAALPMVHAERNGLMQVFLNLTRNSRRAMQDAETRRLCVTVTHEGPRVVVRFRDTGVGVPHPEQLFRAFRRPGEGDGEATGLGLYVSRAIVRSYGGDLVCEPVETGASFAVLLNVTDSVEALHHA